MMCADDLLGLGEGGYEVCGVERMLYELPTPFLTHSGPSRRVGECRGDYASAPVPAPMGLQGFTDGGSELPARRRAAESQIRAEQCVGQECDGEMVLGQVRHAGPRLVGAVTAIPRTQVGGDKHSGIANPGTRTLLCRG